MWFETQIEAAVDVNKPIIVHSREACADTIQCMKNKRADKAGGATAGKHACCEHYGKRECHKFILYHNSSPCVYSSPYYICICQTCKSRPYISARSPPSPALTSRTPAKKEPPRDAPAGVLKPNLYLKEEEKF